MNNHRLFLNLILILITFYLTSSSQCGLNSNQDDIPLDVKVQQSPLIVIGTSLNKNFDSHIPNLFNVTYLVRCILKGSPTLRIIRIVQAGSLLGRRACQKFDVNREYIAFLEPFFDDTYRPVDLEEIPYGLHVNSLLEKTCGLSRTYPFTASNDTEATLANKCPPAVSIYCKTETVKSAVTVTTTSSTTLPRTTTTTTTTMIDNVVFGKVTMDYALLSLLLAEYQRKNFSQSFLQGDDHKILFSDDEARKNHAHRSTFMILISLSQFLTCSIIRRFL